MSAPAAPVSTERSDFRTVMVGGTKVGILTGVAVIAYLLASRIVPAGLARDLAQGLVVLAAAPAVSFLPGLWVGARSGEGIAGAAAMGLWGTVVFSAFDIILLRPFGAYPWTWDALGGGSTWWYLPLWWMLGTFAAWMGGVVAARAEPETGLLRLSLPALLGGVAVAVAAPAVSAPAALGAGAGFAITLTLRALLTLARRG
ncbi:MAG: hypothetical protein ACREMJ_12275 [Gemmatimonadales bacterium]